MTDLQKLSPKNTQILLLGVIVALLLLNMAAASGMISLG